jgi:hypothetical protein
MPRYSSGHGFDEPFFSVTGIASFVLVVAVLAVLAFVCVDYVRSQQSIGYLQPHGPQMMALTVDRSAGHWVRVNSKHPLMTSHDDGMPEVVIAMPEWVAANN